MPTRHHHSNLPRMRGAITGQVLPECEPCPMDGAEAVNADRRILRMADFSAYRSGDCGTISLGKGDNVIRFRPRELPDMTNVIAANFGRPDSPPPSSPAAAMRRAA